MKCMECEKQAAATATAPKKIRLAELDVITTKPQIDVNRRKSFECKVCSRTFGSSSNLKRLVKRVSLFQLIYLNGSIVVGT